MDRSHNHLNVNVDLPPKPDASSGGGGWPLVLDHVENWAWDGQVFTYDELDSIISIGNSTDLRKATTYGHEQSDNVRNSFVSFLYPNEVTNWVFARIAGVIQNLNNKFFQFDLSSMEQGLQFTRYEAPGQHYEWHTDRSFMTATRKLSISVQLSDPSTYKGGELQLKFSKKDETIPKKRGLVTAFPSYTLHRVKPVTEGTRYSLVAWVSGPPFK